MLLSPIKVKEGGDIAFSVGTTDTPVASTKEGEVMRHKHSTSTGLLPPVVRYIHPSRKIVIFDRPPTQVTLRYYGTKLNNIENVREQEYDIWLPWTTYVIYLTQGVISEIYLYATDGPFDSKKKDLMLLPIPNYYDDGRFCQPAVKQPYTTLADAISTAYQIVWNSNFNMDTTEALYQYFNKIPNFFSDLFGVHYKDIGRNSAAGVLYAWSQLSKEQVIAHSSKMLKSAIIPRVSYLPTFKYNPTPMRFANYINEFKNTTP